MPVIVLGGRGAAPIDPTFDDGGVIQPLDPSMLVIGAFHIVEQLITTTGTTVIPGVTGSATFLGEAEITVPTTTYQWSAFSTEGVQVVTTYATPNLPPADPVASPSTPDGGPTVSDFMDAGIVVVDPTVLDFDAFSTDTLHIVDPSIPAPVAVSSSNFTQGTVTNGTTPPPDLNPVVPNGVDGGMGQNYNNVPVVNTLVLS